MPWLATVYIAKAKSAWTPKNSRFAAPVSLLKKERQSEDLSLRSKIEGGDGGLGQGGTVGCFRLTGAPPIAAAGWILQQEKLCLDRYIETLQNQQTAGRLLAASSMIFAWYSITRALPALDLLQNLGRKLRLLCFEDVWMRLFQLLDPFQRKLGFQRLPRFCFLVEGTLKFARSIRELILLRICAHERLLQRLHLIEIVVPNDRGKGKEDPRQEENRHTLARQL